MADYVHIDDLEEYTTNAINALMDGVAGARTPNHIVLNPDSIDIEVMVLFEQNAVETEMTDSPAITVDTVTDTPATKQTTRTSTQGVSTDSVVKVLPSRNTITGRSGGDAVETDRQYDDL